MFRCLVAVLLTIAGCLTGCAASSRHADQSRELSEPVSQLRQLAVLEQDASNITPLDVPTPPGVESRILAFDHDTVRSHLTLEQAKAELTPEQLPQPAPRSSQPIDPVAETAGARHYVKGRDAALADRHLVAITEYNRALELDPGQPAILLALARSHRAMGNPGRTVQYYEQLLEAVPHDVEALLAVALAAANQQDYDRAAQLILTRERELSTTKRHDIGANLLAEHTLVNALRHLGYDRAGIEAAKALAQQQEGFSGPSEYAAQLAVLTRGQSDLWQWVGDAYCRLGEYENALEAYAVAVGFASADPGSLHPRVVYANLRLGRYHNAQMELLAAIESDLENVSDRDVQLCSYLARYSPDSALFSAALRELYAEAPSQANLARAAAAVSPPEQSLALLLDYVQRRPRGLDAVGQLLQWVASPAAGGDLDAAVQLTADLIEAHPDLASEYIGKLFFATAEPPSAIVHVARAMPASPNVANIELRVLGLLGALGDAWSGLKDARTQWPDDDNLIALQFDLAAMLEEPALVREAIEQTRSDSSATVLMARSRALRMLGETSDAVEQAERAVAATLDADEQSGHQSPRAWLELARAYAAFAREQPSQSDKRLWVDEAVAFAEKVLEYDQRDDAAWELLLNLHGANGPIPDATAFRSAARKLLEANPDSRLYARSAAEEQLTQGRIEPALERLIQLYESDPSDTRALRLAVNAWVRQNRLDAALAWVNQHIVKRPGDPALLEAWVELKLRQGNASEAAVVIEQMLDNPRYQYNHVLRSMLESIDRSTGRADRAFKLGEQRMLDRPLGVRREVELAAIYGGAGMQTEAVKRIEWVAQHKSDATYDQLATAIAVLGRLENDDQALDPLILDLVEFTVEQHPNAPLQMYGTAMRSLAALGSLDERFDQLVDQAARHSQGGAGETPQHAVVWRDLAQALIDDGKPEAAARALHVRTLTDVPTQQEALQYLMTFAVVADSAVEGGRAALTLDMVHDLAAQSRLKQLVGMSEQATITSVLFHASQMFTLLGNQQGAEALLREVIAYDPNHAMAMNNLGYARIEAGHHDQETILWIEHAAILEEDDPSILDTIAWLRYKQEDLVGERGALALAQRAIEASDELSGELLDHLGDIQWRIGRTDEAVKSWEAALALLDDPQEKQRTIQNYLMIQTRAWGLLVADPEELYNRDIGARLEQLQRKLQAVKDGEDPPLAPTFSEDSADP